ncbi:ATP-binding protein [Tumidithrix helvetica PCC 7403]|uniref:hybrid sensor histidine kinase/response regulator n=1 Tax=Tumidithrix helvetica TaxID=3457545 RepID=UPI003CB42A8F
MPATKVLVVEDEVITGRVISEELTLLGYIVTDVATSDLEVIASVVKNKPDLVLMDIILKGSAQDGIAIATLLRQQFQIPVIYITAHTDDVTLKRTRNSEPYGYLVKPFNERDLRVAIETALYKHRMERQLVEREEFLSAILKSTNNAVIATDNVATITYMNPAAENLTGWQQKEATGRNVAEILQLVDENTGCAIANPIPQVLRSGEVAHLNDGTAILDRHGIQKPVGDSASPICREPGIIDGAVMVLWDISDRRKAESSEAEKVAIQEALKKEKELNELKSKFIAIASHELRTPLTIVMLAAEYLQNPNLNNDVIQSRLERIKKSVKHMTAVLENMLALGRFALEISSFKPILTNLETFCLDLVEEIKFLYPNDRNKSVVISFSSQGTCDRACIDRDLLRHILMNLLSNAMKYSNHGGSVQIELTCDREDFLSAPIAKFLIRDRGIGIPANDLPFVFDLHYRASNVSKTPGSGIGLAIAKRAVEMHNGQIKVESEVENGTTFTVTLPIG